MQSQNDPLITKVTGIISAYDNNRINITEGLTYSQKDTIKRVQFYTNSEYLSGSKDSQGRIKPFFNIVNYAVNVAVRATDFDTKDVQIVAKNPTQRMKAFLLRKELQNWMKETGFDKTLNDMGKDRAKFGGVLVKRNLKDELEISVADWRNVVTDQVDIMQSPIIETHYMTPMQLAKKKGVWDGVDANWDEIVVAIEVAEGQKQSTNQTSTRDDESQASGTLEVLEVQGEMQKSFIDEDAEDWEYSIQKHYILNTDSLQVTLHSEEMKEGNYKYLPWENKEGRALGSGVVEDGFEAQTWTNDSVVKEREVMELASKMIFKTTDDLIYDNLLTDADNGSIIKLKTGDLSPVNTVSNSIPAFGNNIQSWGSQYERATSTFAAITGEELPSNTPLGSVQIQNNEARSIFDYRREEMGIFIQDIIVDWVLPYLSKKINKKHILNAEFADDELAMIDESFATSKVNTEVVEMILDGEVITQEDYEFKKELVKQDLGQDKDRRYLDVPGNYFKNMEVSVDVVTTNEQFNKQAQLQSISKMLEMAGSNPAVLDDPRLSPLFASMVELSGVGVSPSLFKKQAQQQAPQQGGAPSGGDLDKLQEQLGGATAEPNPNELVQA